MSDHKYSEHNQIVKYSNCASSWYLYAYKISQMTEKGDETRFSKQTRNLNERFLATESEFWNEVKKIMQKFGDEPKPEELLQVWVNEFSIDIVEADRIENEIPEALDVFDQSYEVWPTGLTECVLLPKKKE